MPGIDEGGGSDGDGQESEGCDPDGGQEDDTPRGRWQDLQKPDDPKSRRHQRISSGFHVGRVRAGDHHEVATRVPRDDPQRICGIGTIYSYSTNNS